MLQRFFWCSKAFAEWKWSSIQGRNKVKWRLGQEASLTPPCSNPMSFGCKCTVLKKVHCRDFAASPQSFGAPIVIPGNCDPLPPSLCPWFYKLIRFISSPFVCVTQTSLKSYCKIRPRIIMAAVVLKLSWAVAPFDRLSTLVVPCSSIKIPMSRQSYLVKASARDPERIAPWPPVGTGGPVWETLVSSNIRRRWKTLLL